MGDNSYMARFLLLGLLRTKGTLNFHGHLDIFGSLKLLGFCYIYKAVTLKVYVLVCILRLASAVR